MISIDMEISNAGMVMIGISSRPKRYFFISGFESVLVRPNKVMGTRSSEPYRKTWTGAPRRITNGL